LGFQNGTLNNYVIKIKRAINQLPFSIMWHKSFESDKNEILRTVQYQQRGLLMRLTISSAIRNFLKIENPLAIEDDFIRELKNKRPVDISFLNEFYRHAADSYRYSRSDNQLEFIWDGTPHTEIYRIAWYKHYQKLINDLAYHPFFNRLIIKSTVINTNENRALLKTALIKIIKSHSRVKETAFKIKKTA
jgi:hypothetical protein|tara:strand:- start:2157 stop:2726 length:570 start_codon:yes stop_codon:yes gene_type:complete